MRQTLALHSMAIALFACSSRAPAEPSAPASASATHTATTEAAQGAATAEAPSPTASVPDTERATLMAAFRAAQTSKVRIRASMSPPRGSTQTGDLSWVVETVPPDTKRMTMTTPAGEMALLVSGERIWVRPPSSTTWTLTPPAVAARFHQTPTNEDEVLAAMQEGRASFEAAGGERLGEETARIYRSRWVDARRAGATLTGRVWISPAGRLLKFESDPTSTTRGLVTMTFEYDDTIALAVPPT